MVQRKRLFVGMRLPGFHPGARLFIVSAALFLSPGLIGCNARTYCHDSDAGCNELILYLLYSVCSMTSLSAIQPANWSSVQAHLYEQASFGRTGTPTVTTLSAPAAGADKWSGGVITPEGIIYGFPFNKTFDTETFELVASSGAGATDWTGGVAAPDGTIYALPANENNILKIITNARGRVCGTIARCGYFNHF